MLIEGVLIGCVDNVDSKGVLIGCVNECIWLYMGVFRCIWVAYV